jgi:hypothetical protein
VSLTPTDQIQTGDLLLFSNNSHVGVGIQLSTLSPWVHVGIAVWVSINEQFELFPNQNGVLRKRVGRSKESQAQLYCFETNNNMLYDRLSGRYDDGGRLVLLENLAPKYSQIAWRPVKIDRTQEFYQRLWAFIETYSGTPYHRSKFRMVLSALDLHLDEFEPGGNDVFCSQLVARYFQHFGLLRKDIPAYRFLPRHYAASDKGQHIPDELFADAETVIYTNFNLRWYWLALIIVLTLVMWIFLLMCSRGAIEFSKTGKVSKC